MGTRPFSRRTLRDVAELGESLSTMRRLLNLPAETVADRAGISVSTLTRLESGAAGVSLGAALAVARVVGLIDPLISATEPYSTDIGRARAEQRLPQRVRL